MKANSDKSHLLLSCNEPSTLVADGSSIETNIKEVFLGITIDKDLKFLMTKSIAFVKKRVKRLMLLLALHHT